MKQALIGFTFDDACLSVYKNAFPVLRNAGLTGAISVVHDFVGTEDHFTWDNIREMSEAGWEFIAHSMTHNLWDMDPGKVKRELVDSLDLFRKKGYDPKVFVTPGGDWQGSKELGPGSLFRKTIRENYQASMGEGEHPVRLPADPYNFGRFGCECYHLEQYSKDLGRIREEIDKSIEEKSWCHLGWHNPKGKHFDKLKGVVEYLEPLLDKELIRPVTISQALGLDRH